MPFLYVKVTAMTSDEKWVLEEKYSGDQTAVGFVADKARLASGEPVAYVIGSQPFLGLNIHLDSKPLIPRPETEWWTNELLTLLSPQSTDSAISEALHRLTSRAGGNFSAEKYSVLRNHAVRTPISFLDLCAGSGAIGCAALARLPNARVYFGELDSTHEETIKKNLRENKLDAMQADIRIGDLFEPFGNERFDVIATNPPYVPSKRILNASVTDFEPHEALFAEEDGLGFIRRIATELPRRLYPGGIAWIECDTSHAEAAQKLFLEAGLSADVIPDQYGEPRIIAVSLS